MYKKSRFKAVTSVTVFFTPMLMVVLLMALLTSPKLFAEASNKTLAERVQHLEELNLTRNKVQADISYQLSELQREVRLLLGKVEDNSFKLKQIQDRQRELYRDVENRLSGLTTQTSSSGTGTRSNGSSEDRSSNSSTSSRTPNTTASPKKETTNTVREFEAAFALVRNKKYSAAITAFNTFLLNHPNSNYSANARYWMGQIYFLQNNLSDAKKQFATLISEFPSSAKTAAAKLKLADIFVKQEKWQDAKSYYTDVANNYTGAQQQLGRKGLDKIKRAGH